MRTKDKKHLHKVAESLAIQMMAARSEAQKLPRGRKKSKLLKRFEILSALGL